MNHKNQKQDSNPDGDFKYFDNGFFEDKDKTIIKKELLDQKAEEIAKNLQSGLTSAQLRKFYHDAKTIQRRIELEGNNEEIFKKYLPEIKMIKAKAAYASNPKKPKIPKKFNDFLTAGIKKIEDYKDFKAFMKHFEAVVGYLYGFELKER
ncbi:MAG: type III-A CRISPR-associated protein Csm2 [Candidatus Omnitrophica bacterium]|nr:type III-A CRISPR-associated protein Csm2 [Candidatus Omnitrophota bacterium]